jgi:large subunit ribosomal protein L10
MPVSKTKKQQIFKDVTEALDNKGSVVFVNFHGITVADATVLRKKLKKEGVDYLVAKKSIVKKILNDKPFGGEKPSLDGELALVTGIDSVVPAREIYEFQKKLDGKISILGGIFDGKYMSKEEMINIASIPGQDVLRGMFVNVINSPIQGLVIALDAISKKKTA